MKRFKTILLPTDFSPCAAEALDVAVALAKAAGSRLLILHAVPLSTYPLVNAAQFTYFPQLRNEVHKQVEREMEAQKAKCAGVQVELIVVDGAPADEVIRVAAEQKADLIVIGTHGHTGLRHLLLGSTAERVVRTAPCPVLSVRGKR